MKNRILIGFIYITSIALSACGGGENAAYTMDGDGTATLTWTKPTQNTDDSALQDLNGFYIYYGKESDYLENAAGFKPYVDFLANLDTHTLNNMSCTDESDQVQCVITGLETTDNWYFSVTAVNSLSIESARSDIACKAFSNSPCLL